MKNSQVHSWDTPILPRKSSSCSKKQRIAAGGVRAHACQAILLMAFSILVLWCDKSKCHWVLWFVIFPLQYPVLWYDRQLLKPQYLGALIWQKLSYIQNQNHRKLVKATVTLKTLSVHWYEKKMRKQKSDLILMYNSTTMLFWVKHVFFFHLRPNCFNLLMDNYFITKPIS